MISDSLAEFGHEIDVLNIVPIVVEAVVHLVLDVLVENEPVDHRSILRGV